MLATAFGCQAEADRARANGDLLAGLAPFRVTHAHRPHRLTDGIRARDGDFWSSHLSTVVGSGGGVEWDLGAPRSIGAAFLQADNNDEYVLLTSLDGSSWTTTWTAPRVGESGQQSRESTQLAATARYVRVEPRGGDEGYALTEVALYGPTPTSWPPVLRIERGLPEAVFAQRERAVALGVALALVLLGVAAVVIVGRRERAGGTRPHRASGCSCCVLGVLGALGALILGTALVYRARYFHNTIDDAYISFQYAKNWVAGHGVVFNPGERVEGYTNFLWVALMTPLWPLMGRDPVAFSAAASYLCLACALLGLAGVALIGRRVFRHPLAWLLAVLLLAFDDAFIAYTVFALENQLLIVCLLGGLAAFVYRFRHWEIALGLSFALVAMTRPDGVLWAGTFFVAQASTLIGRRSGPREQLPALVRVALAFAVVYGAYFLWRFTYYGYLFPNTFYLKVGSSLAGVARGLAYVQSYVTERWGVPLLAILGVLAVRQTWVRWLGLHALIHAAYVVYIGGDFYSGHRFLMALTPTLALLAAAGIDVVLQRWPAPRTTVGLGAVVAVAALAVRWGTLAGGPAPLEIGPWADIVNLGVRQVRWLNTVKRPGASIVLGDIGSAGFFADLRVIDVYGVVDPKVAHRHVPSLGQGKPGHEKVASVEEMLEKNPSYIKWGFIDALSIPAQLLPVQQLPTGSTHPRHLRPR